MAIVVSGMYSAEAEVAAKAFYETLSEKDQRRFVAVEARRIGFGGIEYVAGVFGCSRKTIERGQVELDELPNDPAGRMRRPGGGDWGQSKASTIRGRGKLEQLHFSDSLLRVDIKIPVFKVLLDLQHDPHPEIPVDLGSLVVMTQSCDLVNRKAPMVACCPVHELGEFESFKE